MPAKKTTMQIIRMQRLRWAMLVCGLLASALMYRLVLDQTTQQARAQFEARSQQARSQVEQTLIAYTEVLRGIHSNFVADPHLDADAFRRIYDVLEIERRLPAIQAAGMSRRSEGNAGDAYAVAYVEPLQRNAPAIGFDQFSEPVRRAAMQLARDSGEVVATGATRMRFRGDDNQGIIFFMPLYAGGAKPATVAQRRAQITGFAFLAVRIAEALGQVLEPQLAQGLAIQVHDMQGGAASLLFGQAAPRQPDAAMLTDFHVLPFSGGRWALTVAGDPARLVGADRWLPALTVAGGLLASLLLFFLMRHFDTVHRRADRLRRAASKALRLRERAIEASANAIVICDATRAGYPVEYVNPAFERMTGYAPADIIGRSLRMLHRGDRDQPGLAQIRAALQEQCEGQATLRNYRKDGAVFWTDVRIAPVRNDDGEVTHFVAAKYDVTDAKNYEAQLEYQANHDALTGLPNRSLLQDRLQRSIAAAKRRQGLFWVAFIDLDRFKFVNDTMGHSCGDLLLRQVTQRLQAVLRESDTLARHGGDEFVAIIDGRQGEQPSTHIVQRIMDAMAQPMQINDQEFFITSSIGIAVYPHDGDDAETLIKHADIAMYRAKEVGRNNFQFYAASLNQRALDRLRLEKDLRSAIEREEFTLHYQPQASLDGGEVVGMEALIRWHHPQLGAVAPARFISLAEETGLIVPIGDWVLRTACRQNKHWQDAGLPTVRVAVNVSARQFREPDLVASVLDALRDSGLSPQYLEIELTESLVMENVEHAVSVLAALKQVGVQVSIDDFGTGYSSLAYLKRFPIDMLKIDQSFVRDIATDPDDAAIVAAIISLAHGLRLQVIAEGVEDATQHAYLKQHGCDRMQGYFFSRPLAAKELESFLQSRAAYQQAA